MVILRRRKCHFLELSARELWQGCSRCKPYRDHDGLMDAHPHQRARVLFLDCVFASLPSCCAWNLHTYRQTLLMNDSYTGVAFIVESRNDAFQGKCVWQSIVMTILRRNSHFLELSPRELWQGLSGAAPSSGVDFVGDSVLLKVPSNSNSA